MQRQNVCLLLSTAFGNPEANWNESYSDEANTAIIERKYLSVPYGLYRVAHFSRKKCDNVEFVVMDPLLDGIQAIDTFILTHSPIVIGFSPVRLIFGADREFMEHVHETASHLHNKPVFVVGGVDAASMQEELFKFIPWVNQIIAGYGEVALPQLLNLISLDEKKRQWSLQDSNQSILQAKSITSDEFHEFSSYSGSDIPYHRYWLSNEHLNPGIRPKRLVRIHSTSFCPFTCSFCAHQEYVKTIHGRSLFALDSDELIKICLDVIEIGGEGIYFNDDEMFSMKRRVSDFLFKVVQAKVEGLISKSFVFQGQTRVTSVDEEILDLAGKAGFQYISFGIESFDDRALSGPDLRKHFTSHEAVEGLKMSLKHIPITNANLILLYPTCTLESLALTISTTFDLLKYSLKSQNHLSINPYLTIEAYPGAPVNGHAIEAGYPCDYHVVYDSLGNEYRMPIRWLPQQMELRNIVEGYEDCNSLFQQRLAQVMREWTVSPEWPARVIPRTIGIQALANFEVIRRCLGEEKFLPDLDFEGLARRLILNKTQVYQV